MKPSLTPCLLAVALCIAGPLLGCAASESGDRARFASGVPGMTTPVKVVSVRRRGPYLQARLVLGGRDAEGWSLPSEACQAVFVPDAEAAYRDDGPQGQWLRGDFVCQSSGLGPISLLRDRSSRATPRGVPRSQANYRTLYIDDELALLRGVFREAQYVGYTHSIDLVAVVPRGGNCEVPIAAGVASLEYRGKGAHPMSLVGREGLCPVQAFLLPPGRAESGAEGATSAGADETTGETSETDGTKPQGDSGPD